MCFNFYEYSNFNNIKTILFIITLTKKSGLFISCTVIYLADCNIFPTNKTLNSLSLSLNLLRSVVNNYILHDLTFVFNFLPLHIVVHIYYVGTLYLYIIMYTTYSYLNSVFEGIPGRRRLLRRTYARTCSVIIIYPCVT